MKKILFGLLALASMSSFAGGRVILYTGDYIGSFTNSTSVPKDYASKLKTHLERAGYTVVETVTTRNSRLYPYAMDNHLDQIAREHDANVVSLLSTVPFLPNGHGDVGKVACAMSLEIRTPAPLITEEEKLAAQKEGVFIISEGKTIFKKAMGTDFHPTLNFSNVCDSTFKAILQTFERK